MAYSAQKNSSGAYDILQDGNKVATGSAAVLGNYGLSESNLGGTTAPTTPRPDGYNANATLQIPNSSIPTPTPASYVAPPTTTNLPQPTAPQTQATYQASLASSVDTAKTALDTTTKAAHDEAIQRINDLSDKLNTIQSESDPTKQPGYAEQQTTIQNQLDAAKTASSTIAEDFNSRRQIVSEMTTLLTDGNNYINQLRGVGGVSFIRNARVQDATQLIQARAGVLQATLAGLDGNVSLATSIINNARTAVEANWNDIVSYNDAVLKLAQSKELALDAEDQKYAEEKTTEAKANLARMQSTVDTISAAMIDPAKAKAYAQAGVTLLDSPAQIEKKLGDYSYQQEVSATSNDMASKGYALLMPGQKAPKDAQVVTTTDSKGVKTQYYAKVSSSASGFFSSTQLNQGAANSGLSLDDFRTGLDPDTQNWFINSYTSYKSNLDNMTPQQAADHVAKDTSLTDTIKQQLYTRLGAKPSANGGGSWWDNVTGWFGQFI